jgi:hypothetical protein
MNIADIRTGLETTIGTIAGLRVYGTVPDAPSVPCAVVYPDQIQYGRTLDGTANIRMVVQVMVAAVNSQGGQDSLDGYLADSGSTSIFTTIENNPTLGGVCQNAHVTEMRSYGVVGDSTRYYSAELVVDILAT